MSRCKLPGFRVNDSEVVKENGALQNVFGVQNRNSKLQVDNTLSSYWVLVPVVLVVFVSFSKLNHSANEFRMSKVFVVVEIKNNFVACHILEVYEVLDRNRLIRDASSCAYRLNLYFIRSGGSAWKSEW